MVFRRIMKNMRRSRIDELIQSLINDKSACQAHIKARVAAWRAHPEYRKHENSVAEAEIFMSFAQEYVQQGAALLTKLDDAAKNARNTNTILILPEMIKYAEKKFLRDDRADGLLSLVRNTFRICKTAEALVAHHASSRKLTLFGRKKPLLDDQEVESLVAGNVVAAFLLGPDMTKRVEKEIKRKYMFTNLAANWALNNIMQTALSGGPRLPSSGLKAGGSSTEDAIHTLVSGGFTNFDINRYT